jgi:hypothetical protein
MSMEEQAWELGHGHWVIRSEGGVTIHNEDSIIVLDKRKTDRLYQFLIAVMCFPASGGEKHG